VWVCRATDNSWVNNSGSSSMQEVGSSSRSSMDAATVAAVGPATPEAAGPAAKAAAATQMGAAMAVAEAAAGTRHEVCYSGCSTRGMWRGREPLAQQQAHGLGQATAQAAVGVGGRAGSNVGRQGHVAGRAAAYLRHLTQGREDFPACADRAVAVRGCKGVRSKCVPCEQARVLTQVLHCVCREVRRIRNCSQSHMNTQGAGGR
jgi:hypothetical protein